MSIKSIFTLPNAYLTLYCVYWLQDVVYAGGGMISRLCLVLILLISLFFFKEQIVKYNSNNVLKSLNILLVMFLLYGGYLIIDTPFVTTYEGIIKTPSHYYLKDALISILSIHSFYVIFKENRITEPMMKIWTIVILGLVTLIFTMRGLDQQVQLQEMVDADGANNFAYLFVQTIPLICFFHRMTWIQYIIFAYCGFFIILGFKRGALLMYGIMLIMYIYNNLLNSSAKAKFITIVSVIFLLIIAAQYVSYLSNESAFFEYRVEQTLSGDSSGRDHIYSDAINHFLYGSSDMGFLFGYGAWSSTKISNNFAHNDWLEIASDQGVLGVILFISFFTSYYKGWNRLKKDDFYVYYGIGFLLIFIRSFFSMSITNIFFAASIGIGYCLVKADEKE